MKRFVLIIFSMSFLFLTEAQVSFENNFIQGYLNIEQFFLRMGGDYGTTFFPFLNSGYGGRDTALSGAFTAVADDITTIESNPAGTASLTYTELLFSHNKMLGDVNFNTLAYSMRFNDLGLGVSARVLYIPFTHYDKYGFDAGNGVITYTVITMNGAYNFLRSYDFFGLSVGSNVKLYIYGIPESIASSQSRVNIAFDLGVLTRFNFLKAYNKSEKNFSIGLAVKNLGPFTDEDPPPTTASVGLAYKPIEQLLITADFSYLINYSAETWQNWNVRTGIEWYFTAYSSLLVGVAIKSSPSLSIGFNLNFEDFKITAIYNPDMIDLARFSVSATLKLGDLGRNKKDQVVRKMYSVALRYMNQGHYPEAKELLLKILKLDPGYSPAKRTLKNAQRQITIQKNLNEVINQQQDLKL